MEESRLEVPNEDLIEKMQTIANHDYLHLQGLGKKYSREIKQVTDQWNHWWQIPEQ